MTRAAVGALIAAGCGAGPAAVEPAGAIEPTARVFSASCPLDRVVVSSQADVDGFAPCPIAQGLAIRTGSELSLAGSRLLQLQQIDGGDLVIGPSVGLTAIVLPELVEVEGAIRIVGNGSLESVSLPRLIRVGSVSIEGNVELRLFAVPALAEVGQAVVIERTPNLTYIDATALHTIGGELVITDAPLLSVLEAASLVRASGVRVTRTGLDPDQVRTLEAISSAGAPP